MSWPPLQNACAGGFGTRHHRIDRILARQILRDDDAAIAGPYGRGFRVVPLGIASPQREHDRTCLKEADALLARFRFGQAKSLIECGGLGDIGDQE